MILDKTGTVSLGPGAGPDRLRRRPRRGGGFELAASVDLAWVHPFAIALVERHGPWVALQFPLDVVERPGEGVEGTVAGRRVAVGSGTFLCASRLLRHRGDRRRGGAGDARALVGVDGRLVAWFELADPPREGSLELSARLRRNGVVQVAMLTGDRRAVAERLGMLLGIDRIYAEQTPEEKLAVVRAIKQTPGRGSRATRR